MKKPGCRWAWILVLVCTKVSAVIIAGGDGTGNTNGTSVAGWDYVGRIASANGAPSSITYLGNSWFITAYHVKSNDNPTGAVLNAVTYPIAASSWTRITNSAGSNADLIMFKVNGSVANLSSVNIADSSPSVNTSITMIGNGRNRASSTTRWYVDIAVSTNWIWSTTNFSGADGYLDGYQYATGSTKRWGSNNVENFYDSLNDGYGITDTFYTDFDSNTGQGQGATYDSGGGVFTGSSGSFELAGIMITVGTYNNQPSSTAVFGDATYIADLSAYCVQITNTMQIVDLDNDGISDEWEFTYSGSSTGLVASADSDGDGFSNLDEYIADTNPTNATSVFEIDSFSVLTNQTITFIGSTGREYQVFYTTNDLADTNLVWQAAHTNLVWGTGTNSSITVTNSSDKAFYRLKAILP